MTHYQKLNQILHGLLHVHKLRLEKKPLDKKITFSFICNTVAETTDDWEISFLKNRLLSDGYMIMGDYGDGEPPVLTPDGIKFIQDGAYLEERLERDIDKKIKEETLKKFQYDKWAFAISVISILIALLALFI
jgi:hypothetical protein